MKLLFDAGGTHLRIASANNNTIKEVLTFPTPKKFADNLWLFKNAAIQLKLDKIDQVVGGVPSFVNSRLSIWKQKDVARQIGKTLKTKVSLENDAALAGLAEARLGAGKGKKIVAYLTISTGFGGVRIVDGQIDANNYGFEPKLQLADKGRKAVSFESLIGGRGIKAEFKLRPELIADKQIWKQIERAICITVNNAAALWSPDVIVINGPIAFNKNISFARIQKFVTKNFKGMPKIPKVKKSELGQLAGLYGALIYSNTNKS